MPTVFSKLNLKDHREIIVINAPESFQPELESLDGVNVLQVVNPKKVGSFAFAILFVTKQAEVDRLSKLFAAKADGDVILWFAYPKGTSKNYKCDFNRDNGWDTIRNEGFDTVRQIAIDEDWTALRFRRVEFIKMAK